MRCPLCRQSGNRVVDSRMSGDGAAIRRRRICASCQHRFTTYERVEEAPPMVVKKDNRREPYDRGKVIAGITRACEKRPVATETIAEIGDRIEAAVTERGASEVPSSFIGTAVMDELRRVDQVAYVRFASVYRSFKDIQEFMHELEELLERRQLESAVGARRAEDHADDQAGAPVGPKSGRSE